MASDRAKLAALGRVARGGSFAQLGDYAQADGPERKAWHRLALRISSGDLLLTEKPDETEKALSKFHNRRAWVKQRSVPDRELKTHVQPHSLIFRMKRHYFIESGHVYRVTVSAGRLTIEEIL
jgi:hypothetical protein